MQMKVLINLPPLNISETRHQFPVWGHGMLGLSNLIEQKLDA